MSKFMTAKQKRDYIHDLQKKIEFARRDRDHADTRMRQARALHHMAPFSNERAEVDRLNRLIEEYEITLDSAFDIKTEEVGHEAQVSYKP